MFQQKAHPSIEAKLLPQTWPDWHVAPIKARYETMVGRKHAKELAVIVEDLFKLAQTSIIFPRAIQLGLIKKAPKLA